jgi:CBS domain-containing protein
MAATLGGMMRAPIMSVVFAFELTHDINALPALLMASTVSYGFTVLVMRRSILTEKIARRGYHIYREYGIDPLERHFVEEVMTREVQTIDAETFIDDALSRYFGPQQTHRAFPVVRDEVLIGMIDRESLLAGKAACAAVKMSELFGANVPAIALASETCKTISTRLAVHALERLPVVDTARSRRLVGMVSRSDLVKPSLNTFDEEEKREVFRYTPLTAMNRRHGRG